MYKIKQPSQLESYIHSTVSYIYEVTTAAILLKKLK